jgi:hypothetical protein
MRSGGVPLWFNQSTISKIKSSMYRNSVSSIRKPERLMRLPTELLHLATACHF